MPTATVIIVTLKRPDCVRTCLERLLAQTHLPEQIIVVDASPDDLTRNVCAAFPEVLYLRNELGLGHTGRSRNLGLGQSTGEIIAFIDDDSFAHPTWLEELLKPYSDPAVGAVGGRALRNQPGEEKQGVDRIGRLLPNGDLTGNFAADPGKDIEVDHIIGCNMSFRRELLEHLGGCREFYPGPYCYREESDISLRVRQLGKRIMFAHLAVVDHIGAPKPAGQRFDPRYTYYHHRNTAVLLLCNRPLSRGMLPRHIIRSLLSLPRILLRGFYRAAREIWEAAAHLASTLAGLTAGLYKGWKLSRKAAHTRGIALPARAVSPEGADRPGRDRTREGGK